jgi:hypothetical protein
VLLTKKVAVLLLLLLLQVKAVGSTNVMMGGGCEPFCMWNSELTVDDIEFAIELEDFPAWVEDVKAIFQKDLTEHGKAHDRWAGFAALFKCSTVCCRLLDHTEPDTQWFASVAAAAALAIGIANRPNRTKLRLKPLSNCCNQVPAIWRLCLPAIRQRQ